MALLLIRELHQYEKAMSKSIEQSTQQKVVRKKPQSESNQKSNNSFTELGFVIDSSDEKYPYL